MNNVVFESIFESVVQVLAILWNVELQRFTDVANVQTKTCFLFVFGFRVLFFAATEGLLVLLLVRLVRFGVETSCSVCDQDFYFTSLRWHLGAPPFLHESFHETKSCYFTYEMVLNLLVEKYYYSASSVADGIKVLNFEPTTEWFITRVCVMCNI